MASKIKFAVIRFFGEESEKKKLTVPISKIKKFVVRDKYDNYPIFAWKINEKTKEEVLAPAQIISIGESKEEAEKKADEKRPKFMKLRVSDATQIIIDRDCQEAEDSNITTDVAGIACPDNDDSTQYLQNKKHINLKVVDDTNTKRDAVRTNFSENGASTSSAQNEQTEEEMVRKKLESLNQSNFVHVPNESAYEREICTRVLCSNTISNLKNENMRLKMQNNTYETIIENLKQENNILVDENKKLNEEIIYYSNKCFEMRKSSVPLSARKKLFPEVKRAATPKQSSKRKLLKVNSESILSVNHYEDKLERNMEELFEDQVTENNPVDSIIHTESLDIGNENWKDTELSNTKNETVLNEKEDILNCLDNKNEKTTEKSSKKLKQKKHKSDKKRTKANDKNKKKKDKHLMKEYEKLEKHSKMTEWYDEQDGTKVKMFHLCYGISVSYTAWTEIRKSKTASKFIRNLSKAIWTSYTLANRAIDLDACIIKKYPNRSPRKQLTPIKKACLDRCYRTFVEKQFSGSKLRKELARCNYYLGVYINYLRDSEIAEFRKKSESSNSSESSSENSNDSSKDSTESSD